MRILVVTKEVWRDDQNGGNTLTWMFSCFPEDTEIAQVYCSEGNPDNNVCSKYYKLTTRDIVKSIMINQGQNAGGDFILKKEEAEFCNYGKSDDRVFENAGIRKASILSRLTNSEILRDVVWKTGVFKSQKLRDYILNYNPDIIYAPGYGVNYMNWLIQWISSFTDCPVVSLISDDYYSFHQRHINPFFWIGLLILRRNVRKTVRCYDLIYTMTDDQKKQLEKDFLVPVKIMRKGYDFDEKNMKLKGELSDPIKIIHVGNIYYNRWKTLVSLGKYIKEINQESGYEKFRLEIVTSYGISDKIKNKFQYNSIVMHTNVSYEELKNLYKNSDIAVHVEGFDFINRLKMRMSFSTKIIEYLASGCAIMMICDDRQSTYRYMEANDTAILVNSEAKIKETLEFLYNNKEGIVAKRNKAFEFGKENHSVEMVSKRMWNDFQKLINKIV